MTATDRSTSAGMSQSVPSEELSWTENRTALFRRRHVGADDSPSLPYSPCDVFSGVVETAQANGDGREIHDLIHALSDDLDLPWILVGSSAGAVTCAWRIRNRLTSSLLIAGKDSKNGRTANNAILFRSVEADHPTTVDDCTSSALPRAEHFPAPVSRRYRCFIQPSAMPFPPVVIQTCNHLRLPERRSSVQTSVTAVSIIEILEGG